MAKDVFTTNGYESGPCGHKHQTIEAATKCLVGHDDRMVIRNNHTVMWLRPARFDGDTEQWEVLS